MKIYILNASLYRTIKNYHSYGVPADWAPVVKAVMGIDGLQFYDLRRLFDHLLTPSAYIDCMAFMLSLRP